MTLGRVPGPCHRGPGRPPLGPACLPLSRLARPQHCLSHRPILGPHGQLHFPRWLPGPPSAPAHREPWGQGGLGRHCYCCSPTLRGRHLGPPWKAARVEGSAGSRFRRGMSVPGGGSLAPWWGVRHGVTARARLSNRGTASSPPNGSAAPAAPRTSGARPPCERAQPWALTAGPRAVRSAPSRGHMCAGRQSRGRGSGARGGRGASRAGL